LFASAFGGQLADSIGRRKTIVLSMFSVTAAMLLLPHANSFPLIVLLTALAGFTGELYRPASSALLADLVPPAQRVAAFATYRLALNAGWAFGPATGGFIAKYSFDWLFIGDAFTSLLFGILAFRALPEGVRASREEAGWASAITVMRRDYRFIQILLATLAAALPFFQIFSTFGLHLRNLGFSEPVYGAVISMNGLIICLCELPLITFTSRFEPRRIIAIGYLLVATAFVIVAFVWTLPGIVLAMIVLTVGEMVSMPVTGAYVSNLAPPELRGRYNGVSGIAWALALTLGPGIGMQLLEIHPKLLWLTAAASATLAASLMLKEWGQPKKQIPLPTESFGGK
jgi:MFS family permease